MTIATQFKPSLVGRQSTSRLHASSPSARPVAARRCSVVAAAGDDNDNGNKSGFPFAAKKKLGENLDDRIASGEFDDSGSTKEKLTRPLRKVLAKDPLGIGMWSMMPSALPLALLF